MLTGWALRHLPLCLTKMGRFALRAWRHASPMAMTCGSSLPSSNLTVIFVSSSKQQLASDTASLSNTK